MDMETHSNNIIKKKIDAITALPDNYTPNLNSKWELLQAGLPKQKRPLVFYIKNISALAAMLLLIGGFAIQYFSKSSKPVAKSTLISYHKEKEIPKRESTPITQETKNKVQKTKTPIRLKKTSVAEQVLEMPIVNTDSISVTPVQTLIALAPVTKKNKRFTEIDFDAPVQQAYTNNTTNNNVAATAPSFRLGIFSNLAAANTITQKQSTLLFKHNF
jgi:hypothetical protein